MPAKRTGEGGAAEPAVLDARVPPEAAPVPLWRIPSAPDVPSSLLPRKPIRTL